MTGLDPEKERIIEIATIVTDPDLNILECGPNIVVKQDNRLLDSMDAWNTKQHSESGLVDLVKNSRTSEQDAELLTLEFLQKYLVKGESPLCGNTISQDRRFLVKYMPKLSDFFHYRNIDVTSLKLLVKMWRPELVMNEQKDSKHNIQ